MKATREMAEAAFDRLYNVPRFEDVDVDLVRVALDCALAVAPSEPVPGAAVRALVGRYKRDHSRETLSRVAEEIEAAMRADGLASVELPTREEIARGITAAFRAAGGAMGEQWFADSARCWLAVGDHVISLLARRPATDESEALRKMLRDETENWRRCCASLESQLAASTDETAAMRTMLSDLADDLLGMQELTTPDELVKRLSAHDLAQRQHIVGLESQLAAAAMNFEALREQHEALRAAAQAVRNGFSASKPWTTDQVRLDHLLKPAPAEAEPIDTRAINTRLEQAGFTDVQGIHFTSLPGGKVRLRPLGWDAPAEAEPVLTREVLDRLSEENEHEEDLVPAEAAPAQHPPPEPAREQPPASLAPLTERVERLERDHAVLWESHRSLLRHWAEGAFNKAMAAAKLEALDARKGADSHG